MRIMLMANEDILNIIAFNTFVLTNTLYICLLHKQFSVLTIKVPYKYYTFTLHSIEIFKRPSIYPLEFV